jgi:hypothetical protein
MCAQNSTVCWGGGGNGCYIKLNLTPLYGEFTEGEKLFSAILIFASTDRHCSNRSTVCWHTFFRVQGLLPSCMGNDLRATFFMGGNITTDKPCSTQCLGDRLTVLNIRADTRQPKISETKTDSKVPISATFIPIGLFTHFSYQGQGCTKYAKKIICLSVIWYFMFCWPCTSVWSWQITNFTHNSFSCMFIPILYTFRAAMCPSSGELIVSIRHLVYVTLYKWPFGVQVWMWLQSHPNLHIKRLSIQSDIYQMSYWYN